MENRIFSEYTLEKVEEVINDYMENDVLKQGKVDLLERWNYFSLLALENDVVEHRFLEVTSYIDELGLTKEEKIRDALTLAYLVVKEKLPIPNMDINNIYLLVSYLQEIKKRDVSASVTYLNNAELLFAVRFKSLDLEVRRKILAYVDRMRKRIPEMIREIQETEYYELLQLID